MKQISNKEYEKYQQYQTDKLHGRILTPDGLRIICAGLDNDPEKIGKHMLEMKLTSAEANKMIRALKDQYRLLFSQEENVVSFIAATTENVEEVRPSYSYEETAAKYDEIERKIRKIKHALNVFNATTKVDGFDMTIDEMLVFLPQATDRLRKLSGMLAKPEKSRAENTGRTNIIEYEYLNYDLEKVRQDYDALMDRKSRALSALDVLNNTVQFEVEL